MEYKRNEFTLNNNGKELKQFAIINDLKTTNTFFRKKDINKYIWCARGQRSIIDYLVANRKLLYMYNVHTYRGYDICPDHFLLESTVNILCKWVKRSTNNKIYKSYKLRNPQIQLEYQHALTLLLSHTNTLSNTEENRKVYVQSYRKPHKKHSIIMRNENYRGKSLKVWNYNLAHIITEKKQAYHNFLQKRSV